MSRRSFLAAAFLLTLVACGNGGDVQPGTGIRGTVSVGPQCPVEQANSPCPDVPFEGDVEVTSADGSVWRVTTDAQGRFTIDLVPGSYTVVAKTDGSGGPPTPIPMTAVVRQGSYTQVTLEVDTGIR